ncbi:hypothetical protein J18TS1_17630 [Oceanobacillus oncorhynchi subsp. incaldanensis]|uniref:Uncharacterized protein n=2 Tax=Oceanobacillus TaxID=182709 RepID=A0A0A1M937_9BACI|nr:hypothetical protein [Oceanobacillus oncorhynchi]MDM8099868.1 hypothetical protein [Oceanobacillus oncorhynchi]UUI40406.1 hypothetical protein NP440_02140 [Oceanobacillus oncorhynchi]GIO18663.1 hypothetical protein J18TS1_17630 [Oceanobacillus oncorhynchi subsp. incaldanensis]CEI81830.1 hypothetical protein BN997_01684 [Oceanobacillus oncorhynchi]
MKKGIYLTLSILVYLIILTGCNEKRDYETDGPFITVTSISTGPDEYRHFYPVNYAVYENGKLTLHTEQTGDIKIGEDAPVYETSVSEEEVEKIKSLIEDNFWQLPEDVSDDDSVDGSFYYVDVHLTDSTTRVGGLNPNEAGFIEIVDYVHNLAERENRELWEKQLREHIYKMNPDS